MLFSMEGGRAGHEERRTQAVTGAWCSEGADLFP